jgi:AcrR family transcriptional regulator
MSTTTRPAGIRSAALSREQIVDAAIGILDANGERALTFRALALQLQTGHGALQWHVRNKAELLVAATATALSRSLRTPAGGTPPRTAVRAVALDVFTAIESHPWLGTQLFATPWQPAMVQLWEQIARPVAEMGVPAESLFTAVSTLVNHIVGVASQNALNAQLLGADGDREGFLDAVAERWERLAAGEGSIIGRLAGQMRDHDDREEFLAGVDIILAGLDRTAR